MFQRRRPVMLANEFHSGSSTDDERPQWRGVLKHLTGLSSSVSLSRDGSVPAWTSGVRNHKTRDATGDQEPTNFPCLPTDEKGSMVSDQGDCSAPFGNYSSAFFGKSSAGILPIRSPTKVLQLSNNGTIGSQFPAPSRLISTVSVFRKSCPPRT